MKGKIRTKSGKMHAPSVVLGVVAASIVGAGVYFGVIAPGKLQLPSTKAPDATVNGATTPISPTKMMMLAENTIADIASDASKSVVNIDIKKNVNLRSPYSILMPGFGLVDPNEHGGEKRSLPVGSGSGLVIKSDGFILTNNHVIQAADDIIVTLQDKRKLKAEVIGRDAFTDLALLKVQAKGLTAAKLGTSKNIRPGDWAIAIGSPLGLDHTVTLGIVSALGRSLSEIGSLNNVELIQTDAAINPGNSGGPLLNIHGEVIGINTAIRQDGQNIGFAIPVDVFKGVADELVEKGKVARAYVGVYMQPMDRRVAKELGVPEDTKGVAVAGVAPGGPAQKAGLQHGDVIQKVDGEEVDQSQTVQKLVRKHKPGEQVNFSVLRDGKPEVVEVTVADYPTEMPEQ